MGELIYSGITSLDGYTVDAAGSFDWAVPDRAVHAAVNDLQRGIGTHLYGRRMYEVMSAWESVPGPAGPQPLHPEPVQAEPVHAEPVQAEPQHPEPQPAGLDNAVMADFAVVWRAAEKIV